jgi:catechol 2,3-dioxygenase-like lactoylglutathione lyase family enzyme
MRLLPCLLALPSVSLFAQLPAPNEAGVSMGHIHFLVTNPDAHKKIWMDAFGAAPVKFGTLEALKIPGIFVILGKANTPPAGGTNGSVVNHIGIAVKDYADIKAKLAAAGVNMQELTPNAQMFANLPDDVRLEVMEEKSIATPVAFHHVHESVTDQAAAQAWYVKTFGAGAGSRRNSPAAMIPGGEIDYLRAQMPQAPTKGRSLDHIGFEVKNLEAFMQKLQAEGVQVDMAFRDMSQQIGLKIGFVIDPSGTRIELTEGLAGK